MLPPESFSWVTVWYLTLFVLLLKERVSCSFGVMFWGMKIEVQLFFAAVQVHLLEPWQQQGLAIMLTLYCHQEQKKKKKHPICLFLQDLEFHGVMRFFFQDASAKVSTKCIRVSSTASSADVIDILVEKFRPDMRMLTRPRYALYEVHENGGMEQRV